MALVLKDRVKETTTTTGTGSLTLSGAVTGYQSFSSAIGNGNTTYYAIYLDGGSEWEVGIGTVGSGTLSRTTVLASSNSGSAVNFSSGQKTVWCDYPASKAVYTDANGNISNLAGFITSPTYVGFDTTYATTLGVGQLGWDGNNTLGIGMAGGNVIQRIGEDTYIYVKASSAITKGQVCMFTGAIGASSVITAAPATGVTVGQYIIGLAAESISSGDFGLIQVTGSLKGFDTSAFTLGNVLYYDSAVTGGMTATYPTSGPIVTIAAVTNSGPGGSGSVQVRVSVTQRITASTGISVSQNGTGATVTNTAPDQTVSLTAGTGISTSGTYPNFTITNTSPSSGGTVTNVSGTSPIAVANGTTTPTVSIQVANTTQSGYLSSTDWNTFNSKQPAGTYVTSVAATSPVTSSGGTTPTIAIPQATGSVSGYLSSTDWTTFNNKGTVTSVTGTAPVVSSGGATPAISMAKATSLVDGYLSATDWTTFNSKGSGSVTSVAASVPSFLSVSGSPVTTSGTLAISYSGTALPVANGGTGQTSFTAGYIPYGNGTSGLGSSSSLFWDSANSRLGVGTTTPDSKFHAVASGAELHIGVSGTDNYYDASNHIFRTYGVAERVRIDSNGNMLFATRSGAGNAGQLVMGTTQTPGSNSYLIVTASSAEPYPIGVKGTSSSQGMMAFFDSSNATVGSISKSGSSVAYNTSSDYRLKEDVKPMTKALETVSKLKPVTYKWKADGIYSQGFIAHELQEVVPECVTGEKDDLNEDGSIKPQGIDTSFLVATLTAAIQEQQQIIIDLKARIEKLEAK